MLKYRKNQTRWLPTLIVSAAGAITGAFLSRILAEISWIGWPFYRRELALTLALVTAALFALIWTRRTDRTLTAAAPLIPLYLLALYLAQPQTSLLQAGVLVAGALLLSLLLGSRRATNDRWIALVLFLVPLAFYLSTLTPAVGTRDGYELQAASATLGFAHPTGYPLFPILGKIWITLLPVGSITWRINVLCAIFAAASIPLVYGTARRVLGHRGIAAWSALILAFSHTLWTQAAQPEKYTLNALFVSLILYVAFGTTDPKARGRHPHLYWLALVYGLSLTHHRTVLMLAPALGLYILWRDPQLLKRPKEWLTALGIALAPQIIYLYIPWRAYAQGWAMTVPEFLRYISGTYYGPAVHLMDWLNPERAQMFWRFLVNQFGYIGIALAILGLIGLGIRRRWRFLACTALAYFTYYFWGTVWYAYYNDVNSFIPNHMIMSIWIGSGALGIWQFLSVEKGLPAQRRPALRRPSLRTVFWSLLALLPLWMIWTNAPQVDMSDQWAMTRWGEYVIGLDIAPQATILADREKHPPLDYFTRVERRRPDVEAVILGDEKAYLDRLVWDLAHDKTVYLARFLPGLDGPYHLRALGPLIEVSKKPLTLDDMPAHDAITFDYLELIRHEIDAPEPLLPGSSAYLTLHWHALEPVPGSYQVNLRLVDENGRVWWSHSQHPVNDMYPTAAWKPGEVIADWYEIPIAKTMLPGRYQLELGLFLPFSSEGLSYAPDAQWLPLQQVEVEEGDVTFDIAHPMRVVAPGKWQLLGYDLPRQAPPTGRAALTLYWQALAPLPDYELGTRLVVNGQAEDWTWQPLGEGIYPTSRWPARMTVATMHTLPMPAQKGEVQVEIAVRPRGEQPVALFPGWLREQTEVLSLAQLTVTGQPPAAPGTVNFDDRILLLDTDWQAQTLLPGAPIELGIRWQCMQNMPQDYTLFIQIIAPDGTLEGQIDAWPQDGTHPTSQWTEGEVIPDRYQIYVDPDAPPGEYKVAVGWYLLETMQRLPVLNADGQAIDDKLLLSGLTIVADR